MRFLKLQQVMSLTGLSRSSVYLAVSQGRFPKQIALGTRSVAWVSNEIEEWMADCISKRSQIWIAVSAWMHAWHFITLIMGGGECICTEKQPENLGWYSGWLQEQ